MCSSKAKVTPTGVDIAIAPITDPRINGRPVLQPTCNRVVPSLERRNSLNIKSPLPLPLPPPTSTTNSSFTTPLSPMLKSPGPQETKRASDVNGMNSSSDKVLIPKVKTSKNLERSKSKKISTGGDVLIDAGVFPHSTESSLNYNISSLIVDSPGSIAAVRREQMAYLQAQRKMRIAHYGRSKSARFDSRVVPLIESSNTPTTNSTNNINSDDQKRCSFITPNSDPLYVAYHDEEWGVPVHDDKMLFELLVLSGAQVGSDWTSILKKRQDFRNAFSGFDAETVASFTEKQIISVSTEYGIDISRVRGVVDNSNRILEIKRVFGSFGKYIWGFVNHKPISTQYKSCLKIPVKTSKSESISKDMVRRGFRFVGPTVLHSFMQAAGLTNDHLITCHRHLQVQSTAFAL